MIHSRRSIGHGDIGQGDAVMRAMLLLALFSGCSCSTPETLTAALGEDRVFWRLGDTFVATSPA